jgi:heme/copper-type cytochrome/quinol oxidase subunit 2
MKKQIFIFLFLIIFLTPLLVSGQNKVDANPVQCGTLGECFYKIASILLYISIIFVSVAIITAGVLFATGGTPARVALAKKILLLAVGIFVIMLLVKGVAFITKGDLTNIQNP